MRPDGVMIAWQTVDVESEQQRLLFPFLISDRTPRESRVYPSGNPTTDRTDGVAQVVIGVADLEDAISEYRRGFPLPDPGRCRDESFGAELAWFEGSPIVLAEPIGDRSWLSSRVREYGDAPCAFVLKAARGLSGEIPAEWCNGSVVWLDEGRLGWRLGIESASRPA